MKKSDGGQGAQGPSTDPKKSTTRTSAGTSDQKKTSGAGTSSAPAKVSIDPTPSQTNWRETDKEFHTLVQADKKIFAEGGPKRTIPGSQGPAALGMGKLIPLVPGPVSVELDILIVVETQSSTNTPGTVVLHHRPFDVSLLPEETGVDYSQYIQCPHCGRKFEKHAAVRHIPQCKDFDFNKDEKSEFRKSKAKLSK